MIAWSLYPNFSADELKCSHTGECAMSPPFLKRLQALRDVVGPLKVTSGYRATTHPIEAAKAKPGAHSMGVAVDIAVRDGSHAYLITKEALRLGFEGIGLSLKGSRFLHLDMATHVHRPAMWTY